MTGEGEDAGVVYCEMQATENTGQDRTDFCLLQNMYPGRCGYKVCVCITVHQNIPVYHSIPQYTTIHHTISQYTTVYHSICSIPQYMQYTTVYRSIPQYMQYTTVYRSISQYTTTYQYTSVYRSTTWFILQYTVGVIVKTCLTYRSLQSETGGRLENLRNSCSNEKVSREGLPKLFVYN